MGAPGTTVPRRRALVVAVVVAALVAAVVVFGIGRGTDAPAVSDQDGGLHRTGPSSTTYVLVDSRTPRRLVVYGEVDGACAGAPRPVVRGVVAAQTATTVSVRLDRWSAETDGGGCAGLGLGPQPTTLTLAAPLGTRTVREQRSGRDVPCLDLATVPTPTTSPIGYAAGPWQWQPRAGALGTLSRTFADAAGHTVSYVLRDRSVPWQAQSTTLLGRHDVNGHQASAYRRTDDGSNLLVWTTSDGQAASLEADTLGPDELVTMARGVRAG